MSIYTQQLVYSVAEITGSIKSILEGKYRFVSIRGEVSNLQKPYSGHSYFVLKDKNAQIRAVMFKGQRRFQLTELANGRKIICHGRISLYEPRGEYQLIVDTVEDDGVGTLQQQFEERKKKFAALGYFEASRKRELPFFPKKIALVTSATGAAVYDFISSQRQAASVASVLVLPVRVQGQEAAGEIARAITLANDCADIDVIALCRGGGSLEDLWAFNEEVVVQAIVDSKIPVLTGIGHETDYTLADFSADYRAATPTAAGQHLALDVSMFRMAVDKQFARLHRRVASGMVNRAEKLKRQEVALGRLRGQIDRLQLTLTIKERSFQHAYRKFSRQRRHDLSQILQRLLAASPEQRVRAQRYRLTLVEQSLNKQMEQLIRGKRAQFAEQLAHFQAVGPLATLSRGYAIATTTAGAVVHDSNDLALGDNILVRLQRGKFTAKVVELPILADQEASKG